MPDHSYARRLVRPRDDSARRLLHLTTPMSITVILATSVIATMMNSKGGKRRERETRETLKRWKAQQEGSETIKYYTERYINRVFFPAQARRRSRQNSAGDVIMSLGPAKRGRWCAVEKEGTGRKSRNLTPLPIVEWCPVSNACQEEDGEVPEKKRNILYR